MNELVSVVIPVYNAEKYIKRCVKSILEQTYTALEVILVDDGSTDGSGAIADQLSEQNSNVNAIHIANAGVSNARNVGIKIANGYYIAFVDADDYIAPDHIETLVSLISNEGVQLGVSNYSKIDKRGKESFEGMILGNKTGVMSFEQALEDMGNGVSTWGYVWNKIYLKSVITDNNLEFSRNIKIWEDMYFCAEYISCCDKVAVSDQKTYYYIIHDGSAVSSGGYDSKRTKFEVMLLFEKLQKSLVERKLIAEDSAFSVWVRSVLAETSILDVSSMFKQNVYDMNTVRDRIQKADEYRAYLIPKYRVRLTVIKLFPYLSFLVMRGS